MMLRHKSYFALVVTLKTDDAGSKRLRISHLEDLRLYTETMERLLFLIRAANNFVKNPNMSAPFHAPTFITSKEMVLRELSVVSVEHCTDHTSKFVIFYLLVSHTCTKSISLLQMFSAVGFCMGTSQGTRKELEGLGLKIASTALAETFRIFSWTLIPHEWRHQ